MLSPQANSLLAQTWGVLRVMSETEDSGLLADLVDELWRLECHYQNLDFEDKYNA